MQNVLIISGHPNVNESIGNATILGEVAKALPGAEIRFLDTLYHDYQINVAQEQQALLNADVRAGRYSERRRLSPKSR
jgi:putative NADPH-quinone reductase